MSLHTPQTSVGSPVVKNPAKKSPQFLLALVAMLALEAVFAAMARLGDLSIHIPEFMALALGGGVLYFIALYALEHTRDDRAVLWLILLGGLAFRLTLFPHPPSLSTDLYRYRWDGHVQSAGWNPYAVAPTDPRLAPLRDYGWTVMPVPEIPTMYPPLAQLVFRATWRLLPDSAGAGSAWSPPTIIWFKLPFLLADLAVAAMLAGWIRSTGGRTYQAAIYAWNPLVVVEFASSGHNDAFAIAGVVASLLIIRRSAALSTLTLTAGALAKAFPVLLLPLALFRTGWPTEAGSQAKAARWRGWLRVCLAAAGCAALAAACVWPYRHGWREFLAMLRAYQLIFRNYHSSIYPVLLWLTGGSHEIAAGVGEGVVIGLALWLAIRRADPTRAAFLLIGTLLLFAPNGYSWYFTWIVPLLCFFPSPAWLLLTILEFLSYKIFIDYRALGVWHFDPLFQWLCYAPFYALLIWQIFRQRRKGDLLRVSS